jgi:hypothetical protein
MRWVLAMALAVGLCGCSGATAPEQPLAFNHNLHAGKEKIPCRRCHPGSTRARFAGLPPFTLCLGCHIKPLGDEPSAEEAKVRELAVMKPPPKWIQVTRNESHVYFSHRVHAGILRLRCSKCHGDVKKWKTPPRTANEKLLHMNKCMSCHREHGASNECAVCHR